MKMFYIPINNKYELRLLSSLACVGPLHFLHFSVVYLIEIFKYTLSSPLSKNLKQRFMSAYSSNHTWKLTGNEL